MDFSGPEPADFANVTALNRAFLVRLRSPSVGRKLRDHIPEALQAAVEGLTDRHVERLSAAPFLLMPGAGRVPRQANGVLSLVRG